MCFNPNYYYLCKNSRSDIFAAGVFVLTLQVVCNPPVVFHDGNKHPTRARIRVPETNILGRHFRCWGGRDSKYLHLV